MDFLLKQRLVGAIVLVALGVIFIPMLLEGPDRNLVPEMEPLPEPDEREQSQPLGTFPAPGSIPEEPAEQVLHAEPPELPAAESEPAVGKAGEQVLALPAEAETLPVTAPEPEPKPTPEAEPKPGPVKEAVQEAPESPGPLGNWVVQMGSFSSEENAMRLREKLRGGGFPTQVEKVVLDDKAHYRVRVGPYLQREEAERELEKLAKTFDLKGRVLSYP